MIWRLTPAFKSARNFKLASNYILSQSSCICIQYNNLNPSRSEHEGQITMKDNLSICTQHNNLTPQWVDMKDKSLGCATTCIAWLLLCAGYIVLIPQCMLWVFLHTCRTSWLIKGKLELTSAVHAMLQWAYKCTSTIATRCCRTEKNTDGTRL